MRVRLSPRAQRDLDAIWIFAVERWGEAVAEQYILDFASTLDRLRINPEIGLEVTFIRAGYRKLPMRSHSIYYQIEAGSILVIRILHQSQDVDRELP